MYKNILWCTDGSVGATVAGRYAAWLASKLGGRVQALYVTDVRLLEGPLMADLSGAVGAQPYPGLLPRMQEIQIEKAAAVLDSARQLCDKQPVPCETAHETGTLISIMLEYEKGADLVVIGQHGEHAEWSEDLLGTSVERLVRGSIKPTLITAKSFKAIESMLIACDGSAGANKALQAGLELAAQLKAAVDLITVCERESEEDASRALNEARQQAEDRHLKCRAQLLHGDPEMEILGYQDLQRNDMIVMGAYGHTRIREWILGSTTSHVIRKSIVPVLCVRG